MLNTYYGKSQIDQDKRARPPNSGTAMDHRRTILVAQVSTPTNIPKKVKHAAWEVRNSEIGPPGEMKMEDFARFVTLKKYIHKNIMRFNTMIGVIRLKKITYSSTCDIKCSENVETLRDLWNAWNGQLCIWKKQLLGFGGEILETLQSSSFSESI